MKRAIMKPFFFLTSLSAAWMMGIGFRFLMMSEREIYINNSFDKFFDWGILIILGLLLFITTIFLYIKNNQKL